jgi:hypothetical protein
VAQHNERVCGVALTPNQLSVATRTIQSTVDSAVRLLHAMSDVDVQLMFLCDYIEEMVVRALRVPVCAYV